MSHLTLTVADRLELSELVHRYAGYVDARRFDDVAELFTATGQLIVPAPPDRLDGCVRHDGPAGVRAAMGALSGLTRTHHAVVGEVYTGTAEAGTATGAIAGVAHHWIDADGRRTDLVWYLRYTDEYRRTDAGWRIALRSLSIDAIATLPVQQVRH